MKWMDKRKKRKHTQAVKVEVVRKDCHSELWRYSDDSLRCHCGHACLAAYEPCSFEEVRKWPEWPNGTGRS